MRSSRRLGACERERLSAQSVRYRYILSEDLPGGLDGAYQVEYAGMQDRYTVAVGKRWFKRADWRGDIDRYAHGGLSFAEMAVPGAVLRRITELRTELGMETRPSTLQLEEGQIATLIIQVSNVGNVRASGRLEVRADTAAEATYYTVDLGPGEKRELAYPTEAIYRQHSDGTVTSTSQVSLSRRANQPYGTRFVSLRARRKPCSGCWRGIRHG